MIPLGIIPPVLTPLNASGALDEAAFIKLLDRLESGGVHGLFVAGTSGLGSVLTDAAYYRLIELTLEHLGKRLPVLAGVIESSTLRVVERLRFIEHYDVDAVVVVAPYYLKAVNERQLLRHFEVIRNHTSKEMVVYNIPGCVHTDISAPLICDMARRGWITACKDSSGNADAFALLCQLGAEAGLRVYQGMSPVFSDLAKLNAAGCVPVTANIRPEWFVKAWAHRHDPEALTSLQKQCDLIWDELIVGTDFFSRALAGLAEEGIGTGALPDPFNV